MHLAPSRGFAYSSAMSSEHLPHDPAYKQFFSDKAMVESLLRDFVDEDFVQDLDYATLERCSGSYVTDDLRERHDDIIWRIRWRDTWCYIYLLLEFQSTPDCWMAVRMLCYTALLYQDLIKTGVLREKDPLPPVFPVVIYNGSTPWTAARDVADMLGATASRLSAYQPRQKYFLLDESRVPEEKIAESDGIAAILLRLERVQSITDLPPLLGELQRALSGPRYAHLRRMFAVWMGRVIFKRSGITQPVPEFQDLQEVDAMLEERVDQWYEQWKQEGMVLGEAIGKAKGEAIGEIKGLRLALRSILASRFGATDAGLAAALEGIQDSTALQNLMEQALALDSLGAFQDVLERTKEKLQ